MDARPMTPFDWTLRPIKHYADFSGRSPRAEYWWYALAVNVIFVLGVIDRRLGGPVLGRFGPLALALTLCIMMPSLAVTARRFHDIDRSGWWCLLKALGYLLSFWGGAAVQTLKSLPLLGDALTNVLATVIIVVLGAFLCLVITYFAFMVTRGTKGTNRYGPDPYGPTELEEVFA